MWIIFAVLALLWVLGVHFYLPVPVLFVLFGALLGVAAAAAGRSRRAT